MDIRDIITRNRSYRRFDQESPIETNTLRGFVDLARLSASSRNLQPYKFIIINNPDVNARVFENLGWAGDLPDWGGPIEGERPVAYIIILGDTTIRNTFGCDYGIAVQSILLGATEQQLGGCIIGSIQRSEVSKLLNIPKHLEILLVIALGKPKEEVVLEEMATSGDTKYWRDEKGIHHVPKRSLDELILEIYN